MKQGVFVTGTDTDIGKTVISALLSHSFHKILQTGYFKPVQSGANCDSDTDRVQSIVGPDLHCASPVYLLQDPVSPDRAAENEGTTIVLQNIIDHWESMDDRFWVVEGAGGIEVPINSKEAIVDIALGLDLPCVVVASTKLGTINHTVLTWKSMENRGLKPMALFLVGEPDPGLAECIGRQIDIPYIVSIPHWEQVNQAAFDRELEKNQSLRALVDQLVSERPDRDRVASIDKECIWHPFTQHATVKDHREIVSGRGSYLRDSHGKKLFDGISSWWVNLHGHGEKKIAAAISAQAHELEHVIFAGYTHRPAVELVEKLVEITRQRNCQLSRGFFSDNGSTSVEVALKMAYQFHRNRGDSKRTKFLALRGGYHGDTLGAMSVAERDGFHEVFQPLLFDVDYVEPDNFSQLDELMNKNGSEYAAVIVEPMVQGAGGMVMYQAKFLDAIQDWANKKGILKIADEIFTGFYRTGRFFAFEHSQFRPDLLCLSKGITGGFLPLALTMASEEIFSVFRGDSLKQAFLHGHSYTANPVACRAGLASLELLLSEQRQAEIQQLTQRTAERIQGLSDRFTDVKNPRSLGVIGAFEAFAETDYFSSPVREKLTEKAYDRGLLLRPLGSTIYTLPPYCTTGEEIDWVYDQIEEMLIEFQQELL